MSESEEKTQPTGNTGPVDLFAHREHERKELAEALHHEIGGQLTAIRIHAMRIDTECAKLQHFVGNMESSLYSDVFAREGLYEGVREILHGVENDHGLKVEFEWEQPLERYGKEIDTALYRIVQEAVNNVLKHSNATAITVKFSRDGHKAMLSVTDNGKGMDPLNHKQGAGLWFITERARAFGGECVIRSEPGKGTVVEAIVCVSAGRGDGA